MARITMANIISILRTKINDVDSSIWTDDQLQNYLDMHRQHIVREKLQRDKTNKTYYSRYAMLEGLPDQWSGSPFIALYDGPYSSAMEVVPDSFNLIDGTFYFDSPQSRDYYLDATSYDINLAIAECLEQLVMDRDRAIRWVRGNVKYTHYDLLELAKYHRSLSALGSIRLTRHYNSLEEV